MHDTGSEDSASLNLIPLMDILSNLLFFLMASFSLTVMAIVPASVPVKSDESTQEKNDEKQMVTMNVKITAEGFSVSGTNNVLSPEELQLAQKVIPRAGNGTLDYPALSEHLFQVKTRFPQSDTVIVLPDKQIKYEALVETMDAAREWHTAQKDPTKPRIFSLFPKVVISSLL